MAGTYFHVCYELDFLPVIGIKMTQLLVQDQNVEFGTWLRNVPWITTSRSEAGPNKGKSWPC